MEEISNFENLLDLREKETRKKKGERVRDGRNEIPKMESKLCGNYDV